MNASTLHPGQALPTIRKVAELHPPPGGWGDGSVHDDAYAKGTLGLRGGLVPGVSLFAYVEDAIGGFFGAEWLGGSSLDLKFISGGAVQGDELTIHTDVVDVSTVPERRVVLRIHVDNSSTGGNAIVVGSATISL